MSDSFASIFGYGSLMNFQSTLRTMPSARNFRPGRVSISGIRNGNVNLDTNEIAALAITDIESSATYVNGILFEIPVDELDAYFEREHRYKRVQIVAEDLSNTDSPKSCSCWTVVEQTDEEYLASMGHSKDEWYERVGRYYAGRLWGRRDVFPMRDYLIEFIRSGVLLGGEAWITNILDDTVIADRTTSIREYILSNESIFPKEILELCGNKSEGKARPLCSHVKELQSTLMPMPRL
jgi:hypothetical protein